MKRRKKAGAGRQKPRERFVMVPTDLLVHPDWTHLPAPARMIFIDMCKRHHHGGERGPSNNGRIGYGCAAAAKAANVSVSTAYRMLKELGNGGLVKPRKKGAFKVKAGEGRVTEWEITIYPMAARPSINWGERRLHIEHWFLGSAAYKVLSNPAKCILIELMRRYDGGNNGSINFGGPSGAYAGFSDDVTGRALTELQRARFIIQTAPAVPSLGLFRKWRLTMYAADGKPATKDFIRTLKSTASENVHHNFIGAGEPGQNVSVMRPSPSSNLPVSTLAAFPPEEILSGANDLRVKCLILDRRAGETFDARDTRTREIHLETSPATCRAGSLASSSGCCPPVPTEPAEVVEKAPSAQSIGERAAGLFGDALPSAPTPLDRLRLELRAVLVRKRGTQSRLAEALGLSRQTFANALSGRERFTTTASATLRRWLDGEPISGSWPALPPATEEHDAA